MKKIAPLLLLLFSTMTFSQDWKVSYAEALTYAKEKSKPIILVFSGSDWCGPCIKLDKTVWQSDDFKSYANEHYILYRADFPRKKANRLSKDLTAQNGMLAERFNPKGHFPLVVLLDGEEQLLGTTGYKKATPKEYISHLNTFLK